MATSSTEMSISNGMHANSPPTVSAGRAGFGGSGLGSGLLSLALFSFNFKENIATLRARFIKLCLTRCFLAAMSSADTAAAEAACDVDDDDSTGLEGLPVSLLFTSGFKPTDGLVGSLAAPLGSLSEKRNRGGDQGGADLSKSESDELASLGMQSVLLQLDKPSPPPKI